MPRLITFGGLSVQNGTPVNGVANPRSRLAILAVLAVAGDRGIRRDKLAALFWPESDEEHARNALRQSLFTLKRDLGVGDITLGGVDLRLNTRVLSADVGDFSSAIKESRFEEAASLYQGPFLDGVFLRESPEFERWAEEQRSRLSTDFGRALEGAAAAATERGDPSAAAVWWERRSLHDPLSGRVARFYMEALFAAGEREQAIRHAASHAQLVREELEADPDAEVLAFADKLREVNGVEPRAALVSSSRQLSQSESAFQQSSDHNQVAQRRRHIARGWSSPSGLWAGGLLLVVSIGAWMTLSQPRADVPSTSRRVLVVPFENRTGDSTLNELGGVVADWLAQTLQRAGFVEVVDPLSTLRTARKNENAGASLRGSDGVAAIARSAGARLVIWGDARLEGDSVVYRAAISDVANQTLLKSANAVSAPRMEPLHAGGRLTDAVAGALASVLDRRLVSVDSTSSRPPTFAAYREFIRGLDLFQDGRTELLSVPYFIESARLDTTFAQPLIWLAFAYGNAALSTERDSIVNVLGRRRGQLDLLERHALDYFEADRRNDPPGKYVSARAAALLSPGSPWSHNASSTLLASLRPGDALRFLQQVDPERGWVGSWFPYWKNLTVSLHLTKQHAEELKASRRAQAIGPEEYNFVALEIRALIGAGEVQAAMSRVEDLMTMPLSYNPPGALLTVTAQEMRAHGYQLLADSLIDRALAWFDSPAARRYTTLDSTMSERRLATLAVRGQYEAGRWKEASESYHRLVASFPEIGNTREVRVWGHSGPLFHARIDAAPARQMLQEFDATASDAARSRPELLNVAKVAAALGERERALRYLADYIACCATPDLPIWLHRDVDWWIMRNDPQFRSLWATRSR